MTRAIRRPRPVGPIVWLEDRSVPAVPALSITDLALPEGDAGTTPFVFTVRLSETSTTPVTVTANTVDGTAVAGSDYAAVTNRVITFATGQTTQEVAVNVTGDTTDEPGETFRLVLSNPIGATVTDGVGHGTIRNDDPAGSNTAPTISDIPDQAASDNGVVGPVTFTVGDAGTPPDQLTVTVASSNQDLMPDSNIVIGGAGVNRTITLTPAAGRSGSVVVTVTVTDAGGLSAADTFTVTAAGANTPPTVSNIPDVTIPPGQGSVVVGFGVGDDQTPADQLTVTAAAADTSLLPAGRLVPGGTGANRTLTITPPAGRFGDTTVTVTVTDPGGLTAAETFAVHLPPALGKRGLVGNKHFAAGGGDGSGAAELFGDDDKTVALAAQPFPGFTGGVRAAVGDFNGDGVDDLAVGTGPGRATQVVVYDGATQQVLAILDPFEASFAGGVFVAAGDTDGDGVDDLVVTPDEGGGPRVRLFDGKRGFAPVADFFGIEDTKFRGGARTAVGDMNGDGFGDLVVAAGFQGGPRVAVWDGTTLRNGQNSRTLPIDTGMASGLQGGPWAGSIDGNTVRSGKGPRKLFNDFFAFEETLRNGVFVAAGDIDGDGMADIVIGGGPGGGPRVTAFSARNLIASGGGTLTPLANFFGGDPANRGGVRVAVKDLDGDNRADLVAGAGAGAGSRVTGYLGKDVAAASTPPATFDFDAFPGFAGGVFVG